MKVFKFTTEGLPVDSEEAKDRTVAAMSAALLHISEKFIEEYGCGSLKRILIETGEDLLILEKKDERGLLVISKKENNKSSFNLS